MRTFELLMLVSKHPGGETLSEISRRLEIPKSTCWLMIKNLASVGAVTVDSNHRVTTGPSLIHLTFNILNGLDVRIVSRPHLARLAQKTDESVYLCVRKLHHLINVDKVEGRELVRINVELGAPRALHATAAGKAILAFSPCHVVQEFLEDHGLPTITPKTITDRGKFLNAMEEIKRTGCAVSDEEFIEGIFSLAVPIQISGEIVTAISISAVPARVMREKKRLLDAMYECQAAIERDMALHRGNERGC